MLTNTDLTIFHLSIDQLTHEEIWVKTVIRGVCWQDKTAIRAENGGVNAAGYANIYIPTGSWFSASPPCSCEDKVYRGIVAGYAVPNDALTVTAVSHKDMGKTVRHWQVTAQ
ncbi:MAG: DUF6751 family protein [Lentisphaeria bacterium]